MKNILKKILNKKKIVKKNTIKKKTTKPKRTPKVTKVSKIVKKTKHNSSSHLSSHAAQMILWIQLWVGAQDA